MTHADQIRYLEQAGFHYKPAESPDLWSWLESRFSGPRPIGSKFNHIPASSMAELISMGEDALLSALVAGHRRAGKIGAVMKAIDLPFIIGTEAAVPLAKANTARVLHLVSGPGAATERIIHVMPVIADEMPCTRRMTVSGGLYSDGHTAGYYDLCPGDHRSRTEQGDAPMAWMATPDEIIGLAHEMEARADDIAVVTRKECGAMIARALKAASWCPSHCKPV